MIFINLKLFLAVSYSLYVLVLYLFYTLLYYIMKSEIWNFLKDGLIWSKFILGNGEIIIQCKIIFWSQLSLHSIRSYINTYSWYCHNIILCTVCVIVVALGPGCKTILKVQQNEIKSKNTHILTRLRWYILYKRWFTWNGIINIVNTFGNFLLFFSSAIKNRK